MRVADRYGRDVAALGFILLCTLFLFQDAILRGWVYYEFDTAIYYYPIAAWIHHALDQGRIPLWSPYIYGGFPLFADGEGGVLYPLNLVLLALLSPTEAFIWAPVLRFFLAGAFSYAFLRALQPNRLPALVAGLTFAFGSFMVTQMHHVNVGNGAIWLPLILLCIELALRTTGRRRVYYTIGAGMALGMQMLTFHIQPVLMSVLTVALYILFRVLCYREGTEGEGSVARRVLAGITVGASAGVIGLALGAVQVLPLAELAVHAARGDGTSYEFSTSFGPAVPSLVTLVWPYFFRLSGYDYWTLWYRWETTLYVGIAPLLLAFVALALLHSRQALFFGLLAAVSLLLALGDYSPIKLYWLLWHVPGFSFARAPGRFSFLFVFSVAVLAGLGSYYLQGRLANRMPHRRWGPLLLLAGSAAGGLALLAATISARAWLLANKASALDLISNGYLALRRQEGIRLSAERIYAALLDTLNWQNGRTLLPFVLLGGTLLVLAAWYWLRRRCWLWQGLLVMLVAVDLLAFAIIYHPEMAVTELGNTGGTAQFLAQHNGLHRTFTRQPVGPTIPNRLLPLRVATVDGYSSLDWRRYREYMRLVRQGNAILLDLWNVRYVVLPRQAPPPGPAEKYRPVLEDGENVIYENATYLPRAFVVKDAVAAPDATAALQLLTRPQFDPRQTVIVEGGGDDEREAPPAAEPAPRAAPSVVAPPGSLLPGQAVVTTYGSTQVSVKASAAEDSYLVLTDTFYPGWRATLDGQPTVVYRGDYLFRAVRLPKGNHIVVFRYEPWSFRLGAAVSITSTLLLVGVVASHAITRRLARTVKARRGVPVEVGV